MKNKYYLLIFYIGLLVLLLYHWHKQYKHGLYRPDLAIDITGSSPFLSGYDLIKISNYVYDDKIQNIKPVEKLKNGDILFVKTSYMNEFFNSIFPKIKKNFILITHISDLSTDNKFSIYLNEKKILAWFGQNPGFKHKKHIGIPIGVENTFIFPEKINILRNINNNINELKPWKDRKYLIYVNFNPYTNPGARQNLLNIFRQFENVFIPIERVNFSTYMNHIGDSKYVLCPRGNGLDTHRFYEAILMGSIPIVKHSMLDDLYLRTTSLIVNNYSELNIEVLNNPNKYIKNMGFSKDILYMKYWINEIKKYKPELNINQSQPNLRPFARWQSKGGGRWRSKGLIKFNKTQFLNAIKSLNY